MRFLGLLALVGAFGGGLGGCLGSTERGTSTATAPTVVSGGFACAPQSKRPPCTRGVRAGLAYPFVLLTHCGIRDAYFDGRLWVATPMLSDGSDNPPPGWGNPSQQGTMKLVARTLALFQAGPFVARFRPAPPGYRSQICQ